MSFSDSFSKSRILFVSLLFNVVMLSALLSLTYSTQSAQKSKEEVMMERITIIEQAKDSKDPTVVAMVQSIKDDIEREREQEQARLKSWEESWEENRDLGMMVLIGMLMCGGILFWCLSLD